MWRCLCDTMFSCYSRTLTCDRQTDRRTEGQTDKQMSFSLHVTDRRTDRPAWRLEAGMKSNKEWMIRRHFKHMFLCLHPVDVLTHTTQPSSGPLSGTTRVSRYQKGKTNLDFTETTDSDWQWHQLGRMQVCTSLQTDNHASTPPLKCFTGQMPFLSPNQQNQSTEGILSQYDY